MRKVLIPALLILGTASLSAQPVVDARKVSTLEEKIATLEVAFGQRNTELRKVYRDLEKKLSAAAADDTGAKLVADIQRVLKSLLASARAQAKRPGAASQAKARALLKTGIPKALAKLEVAPLSELHGYLQSRFFAFLAESDKVGDALTLSDAEIAQRMLSDAIDQQVPFYERWNGGLSDTVAATDPFRKIHKELADTRVALAVAKDPLLAFQIGCEPGFARVPAGGYTIHSTEGFITGIRSKKQRRAAIDRPVWIGLYEVTNEEYLSWLQSLSDSERQKHLPRNSSSKFLWAKDPETGQHLPAPEKLKHPVVGVNLRSACLYALSLGCRLPTEAEWCAMAAGKDLRAYPWGEKYEPERCNDREAGNKDTTPIGSHPKGRGPFGHYDVAGNVAEWLMTYESGKSVDPAAIENDGNAVVRGGSFEDSKKNVQTGWVWLKRAIYDRDSTTGFRLAKDPPN